MALPTSRNRTYSPGDAIRAADLVDLQDCIVGMKRPEFELVLGPSAWNQKSGGLGVESDGEWTFTGPTEMVADLSGRLPIGYRVTTVLWSYDRGGAGTVTRRVRRRNVTTAAAASNISAPSGDTTGATQETQTDTLNHTLVTGEGIQLSILFTDSANVFYGAVVKADKL